MNGQQREKLITRAVKMEQDAKRKGQELTLLCLYSTNQNLITVRDTIESFNNTLRRVRSHLKRYGIEHCGLNITEPMKNGDPKFFVMLYSDPKNDDRIQEITKHFFTANHFDSKAIKAITPSQPQTEMFINKRSPEPSNLDRILSWYKTHQIRPAAFFGQTKTAI